MKNKEIQEKRMKQYFIQATKDILKGEGLKNLSVRNIADQAGYSYATLYNYFKDVNDLVFFCVSDFHEECMLFVDEQTKDEKRGIEKVKAIILSYINYFVEYPGIFDLFFIAKVGDLGNKQSTISIIDKSLDTICENEWNYCVSHKMIDIENVEKLKSQLRYLVSGMLLFYLNRMVPSSYFDFMVNAKNQINFLFDQHLKSNNEVSNTMNSSSFVQNSIISVNIK